MPKDIKYKGLLYDAPPVVSKEFTAEFEKVVPLSPNGKDRLLRFVWGCDRLEFVAGYNVHRYADIEHTPAKYVGRCGWILEGYQSPEIYDEAEWQGVEHLLGPFPRTGTWDFLAYHENEDGSFRSLDDGGLDRCRAWAWWRGQGRQRSIEHLMEQKMLRWTLQEERKKEAAAVVAQKFGEDVVREFEKAKDTPDAYSLPSEKVFTSAGAFEKSPGGILIPRN